MDVASTTHQQNAVLGRRALLKSVGTAAAGVSAATAAVAAVGSIARAAARGTTLTSNLYPLRLPTVANAVSAPYPLRPAAATFDIGGATGRGLAYNEQLPGPTFEIERGATATVTLTNGLTEATTVHWHGLVVPTTSDGQPQDTVAPSGTRTYTLPIRQRASLNFYHPHPHMLTGSQVARGLAGAVIIRDPEERAAGLPSGAYELPLVIRDCKLDSTNALTFSSKSSGFLGTTVLTNGTRSPYHIVDKAVYRLRILNCSNARVYALQLSSGNEFTLIGNDGGLLASPVSVASITLAPAERVDILVDLRSMTTPVHLMCATTGWSLCEFRPRTGATTVAFSGPPAQLSTIAALTSALRTRRFTFDGMTQINGLTYNMTASAFTVPRGDVERWVFSTGGNGPHPVHVHGASFQVQARVGGRARLYPWESGWKDTVLLNDGETVEVLIRFDLEGRYMIHCHQLGHEDGGMMMNFTVGSPTAVATPTPMATSVSTSAEGHHHG